MSETNRLPTSDSLAFEENTAEIIYHLYLDQVTDEIPDGIDNAEEKDNCVMCGSQAVWYTVEFRKHSKPGPDADEIERWWCVDCIAEAFVDCWKARPWTQDDQLEEFTPPDDSPGNDANGGLLDHQNRVFVASHLDHEQNSDDVIGILNYRGIDREEAVCDDCDQRATWYFGDIHDEFRAYDFEAARDNSLFCDDCIDQDIVDMWSRRPWTPDDQLDK